MPNKQGRNFWEQKTSGIDENVNLTPLTIIMFNYRIFGDNLLVERFFNFFSSTSYR